MNEYREAKKNVPKVSVSSYSPMPLISKNDGKLFTEFYQNIMVFSHQHKNKSEIVYIDDVDDDMQSFVSRERDYFYENVQEIVDKYIIEKNPSKEELLILEALRKAQFDLFFLLSHSTNTAVIMNIEQEFYNIQTLNSTFDELFKDVDKYIGFKVALIPYKDVYITDGIYGSFHIGKKESKELDAVAFTNPIIRYKKDTNITIMPLLSHFSLFCDIENFSEMEKIVLEKVPEAFGDKFLKLFNYEYTFSKNIVPAFFRSTDLANELNDEDNEQFSMMLGGSPVTSFERGNRGSVVPYKIMKHYYQQKSLKDSASKSIYEKVKVSESSVKDVFTEISSFYTLICMINIDDENIDEYVEFLAKFDKKEYRKELMFVIEELFQELSEQAGFKITPIFLGCGANLDSIYEEIEDYRDSVSKYDLALIKDIQKYSVDKEKFLG